MAQVKTQVLMDEARFAEGLTFDDFVSTMRQNDRRIRQMHDKYELTEDDIERLTALVTKHGGELHITALVEDWCPDVVCNLPVAVRLAEEVDGVDLRLFIREHNQDLQQAYAELDVWSIPTISVFDKNWQEVARFVERSKVAADKVTAWINENYPEFSELRKSSEPEDREKLAAIFTKRFSQMVKWYRQGLWRETLNEIETQLVGEE